MDFEELERAYQDCVSGKSRPALLAASGAAILKIDPSADVLPEKVYLISKDGLREVEEEFNDA